MLMTLQSLHICIHFSMYEKKEIHSYTMVLIKCIWGSSNQVHICIYPSKAIFVSIVIPFSGTELLKTINLNSHVTESQLLQEIL